jgi:hypothetical protein
MPEWGSATTGEDCAADGAAAADEAALSDALHACAFAAEQADRYTRVLLGGSRGPHGTANGVAAREQRARRRARQNRQRRRTGAVPVGQGGLGRVALQRGPQRCVFPVARRAQHRAMRAASGERIAAPRRHESGCRPIKALFPPHSAAACCCFVRRLNGPLLQESMAAERHEEPKLRAAAWRRPRDTGCAARREQATTLDSPATRRHGLPADPPCSLRPRQMAARKPVSGRPHSAQPRRVSSGCARASKVSLTARLVCGLLLPWRGLMGRVLAALGTRQWRRCRRRQSEITQPPIKGQATPKLMGRSEEKAELWNCE